MMQTESDKPTIEDRKHIEKEIAILKDKLEEQQSEAPELPDWMYTNRELRRLRRKRDQCR